MNTAFPDLDYRSIAYVGIEGGEGSGKSSAIKKAEEVFGDRIWYTYEPGGSPLAELYRHAVRDDPLAKNATAETQVCGFFASRFDTVPNVVVPAIARGLRVLSDRTLASTYAYNVHAQSDDRLEPMFFALAKHLPRLPDLYVHLDVDPAEGRRQANGRNASAPGTSNHYDERKIEFYHKVREGYYKFFSLTGEKGEPLFRHITIDANRPIEAVHADMIELLRRIIG